MVGTGRLKARVNHPRIELRANLKTSHRNYLFEVAFVWELTKETIHLPLSCLQGGGLGFEGQPSPRV